MTDITSRAYDYLNKDVLLNIDMIEMLKRNISQTLYADKDGVLLSMPSIGLYAMSSNDSDCQKAMIDKMKNTELIILHDKEAVAYAKEKLKFDVKMECYQVSKMDTKKFDIDSPLEIRYAEQKDLETVSNNYFTHTKAELASIIENKNLFCGFLDGQMVGFCGLHPEGSVGLLKIFPEYRLHGFGTALEYRVMNEVMSRGWIPYGQIEISNNASLTMHKHLGYSFSKSTIYWLF